MRIKDFTDTIRHLTDPFNIPEARRMIAENPALTQEQFKAGGIVEPGVTHYAKEIKPPKTTAAHEVKKLQSDFLGKFNNKLVYQQNMDDVFEIYNVIKNNKGRISTADVLGKEAGFLLKDGQVNATRTKLALELLRTADFAPEYKNFKFLSDRYPKLDKKGFRNLDMVVDSIINYKGMLGVDREEALAQFLPDNMVRHYKRSIKLGDPDKTLFNEMYRFNENQLKYITDQVSEATGEKFTAKDYRTTMDDARDIRNRVRTDLSLKTRLAPINDQIMKLANDNKLQALLNGNLNNTARKKVLERTMKVLDTEDASKAMRRLFMLGEAYSEGKMTRTLPGIDVNEKLSQKIITTQGAQKHRYALQGVLYDHYANRIDSALEATPGKPLIGYYQRQIKNLLDKGISPDEVFSITASGRRGTEPYAIFTQALREDVNSKIKGGNIDSALSRAHDDLQDIFKGKKWNQLTKAEKAAAQLKVANYDEVANKALAKVPASMRDKVQVPRFDLQNPPEKAIYNFKGRFGPKLQEQFKKSYNKVGYSMNVPKGYETQREMRGRLEKTKPTSLQKLMQRTGSGIDPILAGRAVVEETGSLLKGAATKFPKTTAVLKSIFETRSTPGAVFWAAEAPLLMLQGTYDRYANERDFKKALKRMELPDQVINQLGEVYGQELADIGQVGLESWAVDQPDTFETRKMLTEEMAEKRPHFETRQAGPLMLKDFGQITKGERGMQDYEEQLKQQEIEKRTREAYEKYQGRRGLREGGIASLKKK